MSFRDSVPKTRYFILLAPAPASAANLTLSPQQEFSPAWVSTPSSLSLAHPLKLLLYCVQVFESYLGQGYFNNSIPCVIKRGVLENPGWCVCNLWSRCSHRTIIPTALPSCSCFEPHSLWQLDRYPISYCSTFAPTRSCFPSLWVKSIGASWHLSPVSCVGELEACIGWTDYRRGALGLQHERRGWTECRRGAWARNTRDAGG